MSRAERASTGSTSSTTTAVRRSPTRGNSNAQTSDRVVRRALALVVGVGVVLRVAQYLSDRSLWLDESLLALNLMGRSLADVVGQLLFGQAAPVPFLAAQWLVTSVGGTSEAALRLVPLLAGLASTVLFAVLAHRVAKGWTAVVATSAFVVSNGLIYYAAELKPYSVDVLVAIVLVLLGVGILEHEPSSRRAVAYAFAGLAAILCSFPSVFVACGVLAAVLAQPLVSPTRWAPRLWFAGIWVATIGAVGLVALARTEEVRSAFEGGGSVSRGAFGDGLLSVEWLNGFATGLVNSIGLSEERPVSHLYKVAALVVVLGLVALAVRRWLLALMLAVPFLATLVASSLDLYPLTERTTLFLVPLVVLLLAEGVAAPMRWVRAPLGVALAAALGVAVLAFPVYEAAGHLADPRVKEELRPALVGLLARAAPGDTLYLHPGAQYAYRYYAECDCFDRSERLRRLFPYRALDGRRDDSAALRPTGPRLLLGARDDEAADLRRRLSRVHGRVWVVHSHAEGQDEEEFFARGLPRELDALGSRVAVVRAPGATAYLYRLP